MILKNLFSLVTTPSRATLLLMDREYTLAEMCNALSRDALTISSVQKKLKLPVIELYTESYLKFLKKISALQYFRISLDRIAEILELEKKLLQLLHIDATSDSATWYLDGHKSLPVKKKQTLLLTGFDLGFPIDGNAIQESLDLGTKETELFAGIDMGEDTHRLLIRYRDMCKSIKKQLSVERPALQEALRWVKQITNA